MQWKSGDEEYIGGRRERGTGPVTSYTLACLNPSIEYTVRVSAFENSRGRSDPSNEEMATPLGGGVPPVAVAGSDQTVSPRDRVRLDGRGSRDPDGCQRLSPVWTQVSGTPVSFITTTRGLDPSKVFNPSFTAPATPGALTFRLQISDGEHTATDEVTVTVIRPFARILRIEPAISSATMSSGDSVRLGVDVYGRQDLLNNDLAEDVEFDWDDGHGGGGFDGDGRSVVYTAPDSPGTYTVRVSVPHDGGCLGPGADETVEDAAKRCSAEFAIRVRRPSAAPTPAPAPINPPGDIPEYLADDAGNQYAVFTPEEGGSFDGQAFSITAQPGAVRNGEIIGIGMSRNEPASNTGQAHHRYTLVGDSYEILAVDSSGQRVSDYRLASPVQACIPLPDALQSNISDVAIAATDGSGSLTILASSVRITPEGAILCGNLSELPATIAAAKVGAPPDFPTPTPTSEEELPDTGGSAPSSSRGMLWMLLIGITAAMIGATVIRARSLRYS